MKLGEEIRRARKARGLTQRETAAAVRKPDGEPVSPQYLNDIEHGRRNPSSGQMIRQLAQATGLDPDYAAFLAGRVPTDLLELGPDPETVVRAMGELRRNLGKQGGEKP